MDEPHPLETPLANADQACKECRRRKAKCNRGIPICNLCIRYSRHCLYEKHSRTPLTRKHLTEVEARLERAEALLAKARLLPPRQQAYEAKHQPLPTLGQDDIQNVIDFSNLEEEIPGFQQDAIGVSSTLQQPPASEPFDWANHVSLNTPSNYIEATQGLGAMSNDSFFQEVEPRENQESPGLLEGPPMDDFEWDERHVPLRDFLDQDQSSLASKSSDNGENGESVIDGMASLTVDEREVGYLGVASGAALLRIIDPTPATRKTTRSRHRRERVSSGSANMISPLYDQPDPNRQILDSMIDSYFRVYHLSYPIVHEPTFRAQYSEVIPRPNGDCWLILAYVIAAIGVYTTSTSCLDNSDLPLLAQAKSLFSINFLEAGNLTLVQALTLISNYQQKRNMPNSGYNYLGLAQRMAMGLGLHKEFQGWNISPLRMEIRRRVWWSLCVFDVGATITFSRPMTWPWAGSEVSLPINIHDRELTASSKTYPPESAELTPYSAVRMQASFHMATNQIYTRVISKPLSSAKNLLKLDDSLIGGWLSSIPLYFAEHTSVPSKYAFAHAVMGWRYRNLRIIMYRPFVIRKALYPTQHESMEEIEAYGRCLEEAKRSILAINDFWKLHEHTRVAAWYALYFLFQAALIPCICLRNSPHSPEASEWRSQVLMTLETINLLSAFNASSARCQQVILKLCGSFLHDELESNDPTNESPRTQINHVYNMMWPNVSALEADVVMQDDAWMDFLKGENPEFGLN